MSKDELEKRKLIEFYRGEVKKLDDRKKEYIDLIIQLVYENSSPKTPIGNIPAITD